MRNFLAAVVLMALAACGSQGGGNAQKQASAATSVSSAPQNGADSMASQDPGVGAMAKADIPDSEPRPIMQAQVVLDRQGFGPGIIDGKMGISTTNALQGFQEAHGLPVTGKLDAATQQALAQWNNIPATRVVRIPQEWSETTYVKIPKGEDEQAKLQSLGYQSLDERLAERFHTTAAVLDQLNPNGQPATMTKAALAGRGEATANGDSQAAKSAAASPTPTPSPSASRDPSAGVYHGGQLVRVPNVGGDQIDASKVEDKTWLATLASLGVGTAQPHVSKIVVSKHGGWLKGYDQSGKLVTMFTVTTGSEHDPLPLGNWGITTISRNPHFNYNPDLFWDAKPTDKEARLPPGPNGPVGVVWIDLTKEHYGIHGTPEPQTIGRTQSHGCVRLTNWDAARLAQMVDTSTKVVFEA